MLNAVRLSAEATLQQMGLRFTSKKNMLRVFNKTHYVVSRGLTCYTLWICCYLRVLSVFTWLSADNLLVVILRHDLLNYR
jgi:hypothetical protein